ncbi:M20/M25/M40 family metallo-hydrolase [Polaromonas sp.]|uniref:M20/M25/M40 family metallo-hydrolase n=1 Tax=Polaromonas sp. TaxID=1869339 RepID=UPI003265BE22
MRATLRHAAFCLALSATVAQAQAPAPQLDAALLGLAQQETAALLETLRDLTSQDSGTTQAPGLLAVADRIERFAKSLGGETERVTPAAGVPGANLVITFKGKGTRKIMLMAHMDTVYPAGAAAARPFRVEGNRAIAPGIADDKSGIAVFLHAMKLLKARGFQDYERVTMVFNVDEERGSGGSRDLIRNQAQAHDYVMSGEPTFPTEALVLGTSGVGQFAARLRVADAFAPADARPIEELADLILRSKDVQAQVPNTRMNWTIARAEEPRTLDKLAADHRFATLSFRVKGRASHAGVNPAGGINAVVEMASVVQRVTEAAAKLPSAKLQWRIVSGGLVGNVIPDRGSAVAELALPKTADSEAALQFLALRGTQAFVPGAEITVDISDGLVANTNGTGEAFASADQRVPDPATFSALSQAARQLVGRHKFPASSITVTDGLGFPAFVATEEGKRMAALAQGIYAAMGGKLAVVPHIWGATDAVWAAQSGKPVIESMGLPGGNFHSSQEEFVLIDRIPRRLALVAEMIRALSRP